MTSSFLTQKVSGLSFYIPHAVSFVACLQLPCFSVERELLTHERPEQPHWTHTLGIKLQIAQANIMQTVAAVASGRDSCRLCGRWHRSKLCRLSPARHVSNSVNAWSWNVSCYKALVAQDCAHTGILAFLASQLDSPSQVSLLCMAGIVFTAECLSALYSGSSFGY